MPVPPLCPNTMGLLLLPPPAAPTPAILLKLLAQLLGLLSCSEGGSCHSVPLLGPKPPLLGPKPPLGSTLYPGGTGQGAWWWPLGRLVGPRP